MDEKVAIESLKQIKEVFDKLDIEFWLDLGTLLGAVRDGKFISWDNDIDLGMWGPINNKIYTASRELKNKGFKIHIWEWEGRISIAAENFCSEVYVYNLINDKATTKWFTHRYKKKISGYILDYLHRIISEQRRVAENSHMPVFVEYILYKLINVLSIHLRERLAKFILSLYEKTGCAIHLSIPGYYFNNLSDIQFYGLKFKVPAKTEDYLSYRYGKDWRIPKKNYIHYIEDGAITK